MYTCCELTVCEDEHIKPQNFAIKKWFLLDNLKIIVHNLKNM